MDIPAGCGTVCASVEPLATEPRGVSGFRPLVLVVDPNPEMTRYITASLAGRYRVAAACDGREGFAKARALRPDLILAAAALPEMSAIELVRDLRKLDELEATPVMLLTGRIDEEQHRPPPDPHAQDYLAKPFAPEELRSRVKCLLAAKAARDALRASEQRFQELFEQSTDGVLIVERDNGRCRAANTAFCKLLGYRREELLGKPMGDLLGDADAPKIPALRLSLVSGQRHRAQWCLKRSDQTWLPAEVTVTLLADGHWQAIVRNIPEPVPAAQVLSPSEQQRSEDEHRLLAETGEILVSAGSDFQRLVTDIAQVIVRNIADWCAVDIGEAGASGRLKFVHSDPDKAALCDALERYPADRGRPNLVSDAIHSRRSTLVSALSSGDLESLAANAEHLRLLQAFDLGSFIIVPLIARNHSLGAIAFGSARPSRRYGARDVQQAEQLAARVAMAVDNARLHEALQRAIRARDDVLGIVAHDLRNPLNAIVLRAHTLGRGKNLPERREQNAASSIIRSAMSMHRLIEDLLDVTRLEAGQALSIDQEVLATSSLLEEVVERQRAASWVSHRELRIDAGGAPAHVWADRIRLLQVFDNLLGNALKFSRSQITVGASTHGSEALFWVADDGPGVSAEDLPRLFDRFWQASKTDRRGAGLGLSIVQGIVRAHGGRVWAESSVDIGATFYFTLPGALRTSDEAPPPGSSSP